MLLTNAEKLPDWDSEHAQELRGLLNSDIFRRAMAHVLDDAPTILDGSSCHMALVASGEVKGFERAIKKIFSLTHERPLTNPAEGSSSNYPPLDDDKAWEQGTAKS